MEEAWGVQICGLPSPLSAFCSLTDLNPFTPTTNQLTYLLFPFFWEILNFCSFVCVLSYVITFTFTFQFIFIFCHICQYLSCSVSQKFALSPWTAADSWVLTWLPTNPVANCPIPHHHLLTSFLPSFSKFLKFHFHFEFCMKVCLYFSCSVSQKFALSPWTAADSWVLTWLPTLLQTVPSLTTTYLHPFFLPFKSFLNFCRHFHFPLSALCFLANTLAPSVLPLFTYPSKLIQWAHHFLNHCNGTKSGFQCIVNPTLFLIHPTRPSLKVSLLFYVTRFFIFEISEKSFCL